jgi:fatty-acyl-CoA synthase
MLSYTHGPSTIPLIGETIGANLERTVARFGDRDALVSCHQGVRMTYREFDVAVERVARGLLAVGIETGDRVGIWAPNCAEWVLVQYATATIGAILVNINPAYRSRELAYVLRQSGARLLVSAAGFKKSDYTAMVDEVRGECPALERAVYLDTGDWEDLLAGGDRIDPATVAERAASLTFDDPINIQYTSGTTGFPKGATLSHHNILNNGFFVGEELGYTDQDRICLPVPFYHCFGMVMGNLAATSHGACIVIPGPSFEASTALAAIAAERCTSLYGVPTMFVTMLSDSAFSSFEPAHLRTGIMAGAPCPAELMRRVIDEMGMREVSICYGMTETSPVSMQTRRDDSLELRVGTVGRAGPHIEAKIVDPENGRVVERGATGELCTRGYSVMLGYWEQEAATAEAIDAARWMHTGDLAVMDAAGYCSIVGRSKDMVIRGGENIYPREIEEFLFTHPDVVDVQVVGVPDERYGEELCAWVRLQDGASLDADGVRAFCEGRLTHYKIPRYVLAVDEFPMTVTGKVQKYKMRDTSIEILGLDG